LHTFTDAGHLIAIAIGLACYPLVRQMSPRLDPIGSRLATLRWPALRNWASPTR